jgi:hypothetical protein
MDPKHAEAHAVLAWTQKRLHGNWEELLKRAGKLKGDKYGFKNEMADFFKSTGNTKDALGAYKYDLEADPSRLYAYFEMDSIMDVVWDQ